MRLSVEIEQEEDGRWIAEVPDLPGVLACGRTPEESIRFADALALRVLADRIEHGDLDSQANRIDFVLPQPPHETQIASRST